jgi:hypothetical protein
MATELPASVVLPAAGLVLPAAGWLAFFIQRPTKNRFPDLASGRMDQPLPASIAVLGTLYPDSAARKLPPRFPRPRSVWPATGDGMRPPPGTLGCEVSRRMSRFAGTPGRGSAWCAAQPPSPWARRRCDPKGIIPWNDAEGSEAPS